MADLGKAYVQIVPSAQGISGSISKALGGEADGAGEKAGANFAAKFVSMVKGAIAAAGIGKAISAAIDQGSELQQNLGGTEAVWQGFADTIQSTATEAYKNMGMSASDYMATANKIGTLMQGSGIDQAAALEMTTNAMQRAADVASVMGISTEEAMNAITGAAKGNFTMMDNIGVAMNATTIEAYAKAKKGWENFSWNTATNAQKTALAMEMFMEQTGQYAGNFARESAETMSGSLGAMKSAFEDLLGNLALGRSVEAPLKNLQTTVTAYLHNLLPAVSGIVTQLPTMLLSTVVGLAPDLVQSGAEMINGIISGFSAQIPVLITTLIMAASTIGDTLLEAAPELISSGIELLRSLAEGFVKALPFLSSRIPRVIMAIANGLVSNMSALIQAALQIIVELANGLMQAIPTLLTYIPQIVSSIVETLKEEGPQIGAAGLQLIVSLASGILENLPEIISAGIEMLTALINGLIGAIPQLVAALPQIWNAIKTAFAAVDWAALGRQLIEKVRTSLSSSGASLRAAATGVWNSVKTSFAGIDWKALGKDLIDGIKKGLTNAAGSLYSSVKDIIKRALGAGREEAEVGSPSKLFAREIGRWIPAGIAVGIEGNLSPVDRAIRGAIDTAAGAMPSEAVPAAAAGSNINVYMTVSGAEDPGAWAETFARSLKRQVRMGAI